MYFIYRLLRLLMYPFLNFIIPTFSKSLKERINFENVEIKKDDFEFTFEVSSEGELEQVKVPMLYLLDKGKKIELLYCSPSVKLKCQELENQYENLYVRPLAIISFFPFGKNYYSKLPQGKIFVMCRYDFFPELMHYSYSHPSVLLSASAQNYGKKSFLIKKYLKYCYRHFNYIIAATKNDQDLFKEINPQSEIMTFDFRSLSIKERQLRASSTIGKKSSALLESFIPYISSNKSIIFGSFWNDEYPLLSKDLTSQYIPVLAPHKLSSEETNQLKAIARNNGDSLYLIEADTTAPEIETMIKEFEKSPGVWVITIKGILCELYTYFNYAYVGGGFGVSVHSVLEPFMANCHVFFGPVHHRSSEKIAIETIDINRVHPLGKMSDFYSYLNESGLKSSLGSPSQVEELNIKYKQILKWLDW